MKRILLVDDDKALLRLLQERLVAAGHEVVALSDFQAAKNYLAFNVPDAIVTDIRLGAFNGLQLVVLTKRAHPHALAITMTGFDDNVTQEEAARIGARYLVKPITADDVLELLD